MALTASEFTASAMTLYGEVSQANNGFVALLNGVLATYGINAATPSLAGLTQAQLAALKKDICRCGKECVEILINSKLSAILTQGGYANASAVSTDVNSIFKEPAQTIIKTDFSQNENVNNKIVQKLLGNDLVDEITRLVAVRDQIVTSAAAVNTV